MLLEVTRKRPIIIILLLIDLRKVVLISQMLITNTKLPVSRCGFEILQNYPVPNLRRHVVLKFNSRP